MADAQPKWLQKFVTVERGNDKAKYLLFGWVTKDNTEKTSGARKNWVEVKDSTGRKTWTRPGTLQLVDFAEHKQAFEDAQGSGKVYRLDVKGEESDEASSSDESPAPLAVGDRILMGERSGVIAALPQNKFTSWWKLRLDGEEEDRNVRRCEFWRMGEQPAPAPAPAAPRRSGRADIGQVLEALERCDQCTACLSIRRPPPGCECSVCKKNQNIGVCKEVRKARETPPDCVQWGRTRSQLPAIRADETGSRHRGDPDTAEAAKLKVIAARIRRRQPPGGDLRGQSGQANQHAAAVFRVGAPGMLEYVRNVIQSIGEDATDPDLAEYIAAHLEEVCANLEEDGYLDTDQLAELQHLVRAAARKPDSEAKNVRCRNVAGNCSGCAVVEAVRGTAMYNLLQKRPANACLQKVPEAVDDSTRQSRTWVRISKDLCAYLRRQILALEEGSGAEDDWIRRRARVAVNTRSERQARCGALSDWTIALAAAHRANRENMFTEHLKGAIYNNDLKHRSARWAEWGDENALVRFAFPDDVLYLRET